MEPASSGAEMKTEDLHVEWGVNRWVIVERGERSVQRQVSKATELAVAIREVTDATWQDALEEAEQLWRKRPGDAGARLAQGRQSLVAATGLSTRAVFAVLAIFVVVFALLMSLR
jgi:hypothetical protein